MEAKEKAKELRDKFIESTKVFYQNEWKTDLSESKKCALICVEEINNALKKIPEIQVSGNLLLDQIKYYQKVKEEISNL